MMRKSDPRIAELRQLCSLGLPVETVAVELASALQGVVPCAHVSFFLP